MLTAHSDVFSAMFQHKESVETSQSCLKITDFNSQIVSKMLKYLYSGQLSEKLANESMIELLKIAEKYQLELLKSTTQEKLISRFYFEFIV